MPCALLIHEIHYVIESMRQFTILGQFSAAPHIYAWCQNLKGMIPVLLGEPRTHPGILQARQVVLEAQIAQAPALGQVPL